MIARASLLIACIALLGCATSHGVHHGVHTFARNYNNAHIITGSEGFVMVDAGLEADGQSLEADLSMAGFDPARLEAIVLTHAHADHAGGARHFQQTYGTKVIVGKGDADMLGTGRNDPLCPIGATARRRLEKDQDATYVPLQPDVIVDAPLELGDVSSANGIIIPLPGHTEGSLVLVANEHAFVGDLFRGAIVGNEAQRHFYMCDVEDNDADIRTLLDGPASGVSTFFVGHFGPIERADVEGRSLRPRPREPRARSQPKLLD